MDRRVTPPKGATSPTSGPPPPCKQALKSPPPKTVKAKNYRSFDPESFRADLNRVLWDVIKLESDPDNLWNSFKDLFMTAADSPVLNPRVR